MAESPISWTVLPSSPVPSKKFTEPEGEPDADGPATTVAVNITA